MSPAGPRRPIITRLHRKLIILISAAGLVATAVGCSHPADSSAPSHPTTPTAVARPLVPPAPQPVADGPCRYLPAGSVQAANGERVATVRISGTAADQPYPACFFLT